jgi:hypothetical protein
MEITIFLLNNSMQLEFYLHDEASKKTVVVRDQLGYSADYVDLVAGMQLPHRKYTYLLQARPILAACAFPILVILNSRLS